MGRMGDYDVAVWVLFFFTDVTMNFHPLLFNW